MISVSQRLNSKSAARGLSSVGQTSKRDRNFHQLKWEIIFDTSEKLQPAIISISTAEPHVNDRDKVCLKSGIVWAGRVLVGGILKLSTHTE